ncbi:hypothetical protein ACFE04_000319 [Oxalis oulophora]
MSRGRLPAAIGSSKMSSPTRRSASTNLDEGKMYGGWLRASETSQNPRTKGDGERDGEFSRAKSPGKQKSSNSNSTSRDEPSFYHGAGYSGKVVDSQNLGHCASKVGQLSQVLGEKTDDGSKVVASCNGPCFVPSGLLKNAEVSGIFKNAEVLGLKRPVSPSRVEPVHTRARGRNLKMEARNKDSGGTLGSSGPSRVL